MKLKLKHLDFVNNGKVRLIRLPHWDFNNVNLQDCELSFNAVSKEPFLRYENVTFGLDQIKVYKRPLSDLTKEIEVNGEKFVPIVEIGKILGFGFLQRFEEEDGIVEYGWNSHGMEDTQPYAFGYFEDGKFGVWYDSVDDSYPIDEHCSLSSMNKLFEWHFDVFGLIEQGLAIDFNTLEK